MSTIGIMSPVFTAFSRIFLAEAILFLLAGTTAYGQAPTGTITGSVTDSSGAVMPGATVTIADKSTNTIRNLTANDSGLFSAPALAPGEYAVSAAMQGFRTTQRVAQVVAGSTTTVDMAMSVGESREVVTVEAASAQINYDSHSVSGIIGRENIQDIPLNGRSPLQLAALEPGVTVTPGASSQFNSMFNVTILGGVGGNGARITIDGGVINDEVEGNSSINFSQEIVQEFQLSSVNFDASTGVGTTGTINIVTRTGGNDFHGSLYYYYRDHNMASYPGLQRSAANPNPFFQRKNPGVWASGPVIKNKLFFFASYEHMGQTSVITSQNDLPSMQPLNGIFPSPLHYNWITTRFDYRLNEKHNMFLRHSHDGNKNFGPYNGTGAPSSWVYNTNWSDQTIMGVTSILSSSLVNDFRAQYHYWQNGGPNANPEDCKAPCVGIGLPAIISMVGSSTYTYGAGNDPNGPQFHQNRSYQALDTVSWQKGVHRIRFGVDVERTTTAYTPWDKCDPGCISLYSPETTRALGGAFPAGAFATLPSLLRTTDDLLNLPISPATAAIYSGVGIGNGSFPNVYQHDQGRVNWRSHPWLSDTWKVSQNLTVNAGLSYNVETGLFSSNLAIPQYLAPIFNGQNGGVPSGLTATKPNTMDFAPMAGFAWSLGKDKKTVIRGGAGIYWDTVNVWQQFTQPAYIGPAGNGRYNLAASAFTNIFPGKYVQTSTGVQPLPVGAPLPIAQLSNVTLGNLLTIVDQQLPLLSSKLFGNTPTDGPFSVSGVQVVKQAIEIYPSKYPQLRSYQTSIGVQRELPLNLMFTFDFARRKGVHSQLGELDLNRFGRFTADGIPPVIPRCATAPDFDPTHNCSTGGITVWNPQGVTLYRGLLFKLQKRYANHFQAQASYAFQDNQVLAANVNLDNYRSTYGPNLARHNFNVAGVVDLPFKLKMSINSSIISAAPANPVITGIDLNGSGNTTYPLAFTTSLGYACFNVGCGKDDLVKAVDNFNTTIAGTRSRNGVTVPKINLPAAYELGAPVLNQDVRLTKEFSYKESYKLTVFGEFFNALNLANKTYTNNTLNSSAFGKPSARVGQASTFSSGGPRAIQVGARISF